MNFRQFFASNAWWGKMIGACLGYLILGPTGAVFGILIGNFFDKGLSEHFSSPHWYYHAEKRQAIQKIFFEATFTVMGHIAKADGRVSSADIDMAKGLMQEMNLKHAQKTLAQSYYQEGKQPLFQLIPMLTQLKQTAKDNPELLKLFIDIQYRAAQVNGLSYKKQQVMNTILTVLGFAPLHKQYRFYDDFIYHTNTNHQYQSSAHNNTSQRPTHSILDHAYGLLEIDKTATKHEVTRAYRRLMSRNHPDKMIARGLPDEMIKMANEKTHKIRKAYEEICSAKGW